MQKWQENNNRSLKPTSNGVSGGGNEQPQETNGELIWNFSGKNKGKKVSDLDPNTCVWYLDNLDHLDAPENAHYKKALQAIVNGS